MVVDKAKGPVLLGDAEPAGAIRRVQRLVNSGGDLLLEDVDDFVEQACGDGDVLEDPRVCAMVGIFTGEK